jgi:hypothetical protein
MTPSNKTPTARSRWEKRLATGLIVLGLLLVLFFGFRAVRSFLRIQFTGLEPGTTDVELIRGWMTIPYIAAAYDVPEEYLFEQTGIPQANNQKKSLYRLNSDYFEGEPEAIRKVIQAAILKYQAEHLSSPERNHE